MQRMQQDAIRRVREMQSRVNQNLSRSQPTAPPEHPVRETGPQSQQNHSPPPSPRSSPPSLLPELSLPQSSPLNSLFDGLLQDGERTLILVLILILVSEKADTGLIFALMYLVI